MLSVDVITWNTGHESYREDGREADDYCLYLFKNPTYIVLGEETVKTRNNAFILYDIGYKQSFKAASKEWNLDFVHFGGQEAGQLITDLMLPLNQIFYLNEPQYISSMIKKLTRETIRNYSMRQITLDIMLRSLLLKLSQLYNSISSKTPSMKDNYVTLLRELRREIVEDPSNDWTIKTMAKKVSLSESHFRKLYKSFHGVSPVEDLINIRIEQAAYLMNCCGISVKDAAQTVGYKNEYHFIRIFKEKSGLTPGSFLKSHQGGDVDNPYPNKEQKAIIRRKNDKGK